MTVFQRIAQLQGTLTAGQRQIAAYILENNKRVAFMNSMELAKEVGISNPSVIRFAKAIGYDGFPEFQAALQNAVQNDLSSLERLSYMRLDAGDDVPLSIFPLEIENIGSVYEGLDREALQRSVELLGDAKTVFIFGKQISESVAMFAAYTLGKIVEDVRMVKSWTLQDERAFRACPERCCALVVALPRYPAATLDFLELLARKGIPAVVITGEASTFPYKEKTACLLAAAVRYISFIDPIAAVFCLINSIAIGVIQRRGQTELEPLQAFEEYIRDNNVYYVADPTGAEFPPGISE